MANIQVRKGKSGQARYRARVSVRGRIVSQTFRSRSDAKAWARKVEYERDSFNPSPFAFADKKTLLDLLSRYESSVLIHHKSTYRNYHPHIVWWKAHIGQLRLRDITSPVIAEYRDKLKSGRDRDCQEERSAATVNRYLATLSRAFSIAVREWEWLADNPVKRVRRLKEPRGRTRFLSADERTRLLGACQDSYRRELYPVVLLAISTGMRLGEIMNLEWDDIDFERKRLIIQDSKNGDKRGIPLVYSTLLTLSSYRKVRRLDSTLVFPGANPCRPLEIHKCWMKALKDAKIENFRFHDLRHTAASYLAMSGASLAEIAEILGHKTLSMVKRYTHLSEGHKAYVLERMNQEMLHGKSGEERSGEGRAVKR